MTRKANYHDVLCDVAAEVAELEEAGEVASYIPELGAVDPHKLGVHLETVDGEHYSFGDADERFSIQSISKVLSLALALARVGDEVWTRVGVEPSGSAFNSLVQLEYERGIPRNPFINAGAIVVCDILLECLRDPMPDLLGFIGATTGVSDVSYSEAMYASEGRHRYRNAALTNLMKDFGNIHGDVDEVLDVYFKLCSIEMSCRELAQTFSFLAADGVSPIVGERIVSARQAKRINSIMQLCGFYDESGEFAFKAGLPGKSGVGGGIVAVHPREFAIAVWSPKLNAKGNSYKGMKVLELVTTKTRSSIF